jgi:prevent-host-death family protein
VVAYVRINEPIGTAMLSIPATRFRADLYKVLDEVIATGRPIEVALRGRKVRVVPVEPPNRLQAMEPRPDYIVGDPDRLVGPSFDTVAWEKRWRRRARK